MENAYKNKTRFSENLVIEMDYLEWVSEKRAHTIGSIRFKFEHSFLPVLKLRSNEMFGHNELSIIDRKMALIRCKLYIVPLNSTVHSWIWQYLYNTVDEPFYNERIEIIFSFAK